MSSCVWWFELYVLLNVWRQDQLAQQAEGQRRYGTSPADSAHVGTRWKKIL